VIAASSISPYGAALIGAIGALIGGALTSGTTLLVDWRRRRSEKQGQKQREDRELRQAIRLVLSELEEIDYAMRDLVRSTKLNPDKRLPAYAWAEHKSILAVHLDDGVWASVTSAYREENDLNWRLAAPRLLGTRSVLNEQEKKWVRPPWLAVRGAQQALGPLIEPSQEKAKGKVRAHQEVTGKVDKDLWPQADASDPPLETA
jgi:hypothetical protein